MINPQTVSEAFIKWMQDNGYGTFDPNGRSGNIFLNQIPDDAPDNAFWVVTSGGPAPSRMVTPQSIQEFSTQVFYRNISGAVVERKLFELSHKVNTRGSFELDGFDVYMIETTMPQDNDRDAENRRQASLVVSSQIYVNYVS